MAYPPIWLLWVQGNFEERLVRLEGEVRADPATSADGSHALPNGLSASFEHNQ